MFGFRDRGRRNALSFTLDWADQLSIHFVVFWSWQEICFKEVTTVLQMISTALLIFSVVSWSRYEVHQFFSGQHVLEKDVHIE